jgi:hypothetical protein
MRSTKCFPYQWHCGFHIPHWSLLPAEALCRFEWSGGRAQGIHWGVAQVRWPVVLRWLLIASFTFASGAGLAVSFDVGYLIYRLLPPPARLALNLVSLARSLPRFVLGVGPRTPLPAPLLVPASI